MVAKTASDFIGSHVGQSQNNTKMILESAQGKVLIIDEAYALDDNLYGKQVLDTLVEKVQGTPSDDMAVLLVGYEQQMLRMVKGQNPGILRRFPEAHALYFDDYSEDELLEILALNLTQQGVTATLEFTEKALDILRIQKKQANFGNAGSVENLIKGAALKAAQRGVSPTDLVLRASDIENAGENRSEKEEDPFEKLDKLFRVEDIKKQLVKMSRTWAVAKSEGDDSPSLGHFVFRGAPGKLRVLAILFCVICPIRPLTSTCIASASVSSKALGRQRSAV